MIATFHLNLNVIIESPQTKITIPKRRRLNNKNDTKLHNSMDGKLTRTVKGTSNNTRSASMDHPSNDHIRIGSDRQSH